MQSILFAILVVISVNIQPAEAQSKDTEKPTEAVRAGDDNLQRTIQAVEEAIKIELFAKMQKRGSLSEYGVLSSNSDLAFQYVQSFREKLRVHLIQDFIDAIKAGDKNKYIALSNLRKEYGYTESEIIESSSLSMREWMQIMVNTPSNQKFFTSAMISTLDSAIAYDSGLLHVYSDYIVSLRETAQKTGNRSALKFLNNVDKFLMNLNEIYNNGELRKYHTLLKSQIRKERYMNALLWTFVSLSGFVVSGFLVSVPIPSFPFPETLVSLGKLQAFSSALMGLQAVASCRKAFFGKPGKKQSGKQEL